MPWWKSFKCGWDAYKIDSRRAIQIDASKLEKDLKYVVYVKVSDPLTDRSAISYQLLEIQEGAPPSLRFVPYHLSPIN